MLCSSHKGVKKVARPSSSHRAQLVNCTQQGEASGLWGRRWEGGWGKNGGYFSFLLILLLSFIFNQTLFIDSLFEKWFLSKQKSQFIQLILLGKVVLLNLFMHSSVLLSFKMISRTFRLKHFRMGHTATMSWKGRCSTKKTVANTSKDTSNTLPISLLFHLHTLKPSPYLNTT